MVVKIFPMPPAEDLIDQVMDRLVQRILRRCYNRIQDGKTAPRLKNAMDLTHHQRGIAEVVESKNSEHPVENPVTKRKGLCGPGSGKKAGYGLFLFLFLTYTEHRESLIETDDLSSSQVLRHRTGETSRSSREIQYIIITPKIQGLHELRHQLCADIRPCRLPVRLPGARIVLKSRFIIFHFSSLPIVQSFSNARPKLSYKAHSLQAV